MATAMREKWTDERLDDLNRRVDGGFRETREEIRALRGETREFRAEMREFQGETNARFDSMQRTMLQAVVAMTAGYLAGFGGLAALIATQL
jgi:uncharacterized protein YukE